MTATEVDGLAVIAEEPAESPLRDGAGNQVYFKRIRKLLLEDESVVYGCTECDFTHPSVNAVRPHFNRHRAPASRAASRKHEAQATVAELMKRLNRLTRITAERDRWKARAIAAEAELRVLRKLVRGE